MTPPSKRKKVDISNSSSKLSQKEREAYRKSIRSFYETILFHVDPCLDDVNDVSNLPSWYFNLHNVFVKKMTKATKLKWKEIYSCPKGKTTVLIVFEDEIGETGEYTIS